MNKHIVIIGTGLAGYMLAKEYRKLNADNRLTLITKDDGAFYSKPLLSTALAQQKTPDQLAVNDVVQMRSQLQADVHTYSVVQSINPHAKTLHYTNDDGDQKPLRYDQLVLATGAEKIVIPLTGDALNDVLSVNNLEDYRLFRAKLFNKKRIVILGAGFVGCEFANDLINAGHEVTIVAPDAYPLMRLVPKIAGEFLQSTFANAGVNWRLSCFAQQVNHDGAQYQVYLSDGTVITADLVFSAVGLRPDVQLAKSAGLLVDRGVVVNHQLQTSDSSIYALGDCVQMDGALKMYVAPILHAAKVLAQTLLGAQVDLHYGVMPIMIKTSLVPVVVVPPDEDISGEWQFEQSSQGVRALFFDQEKILRGFVLAGIFTKEKMQLTKQMDVRV